MYKWILICLALFLSCASENPQLSLQDIADKDIDDLQIADDFDFATSRSVEVVIQDENDHAVYSLYFYNDSSFSFEYISHVGDDGSVLRDTLEYFDEGNQLVATGKIVSGQLQFTLDVPTLVKKLYFVRRVNTHFTSGFMDIYAGHAEIHFDTLNKISAAGDSLLAVNSDAEIFTVSPTSFEMHEFGALPAGASAVAFDELNNIIYVICDKEKHVPLYKYDLSVQEWEMIAKLKQNCYRLAFNPFDGLLYSGYKSNVFVIDPLSGEILFKYKIKDINKDDGGDYVFDHNGEFYIACESGLYALTFTGSKYYATEKSHEVRDFSDATGTAIDSEGMIWISTSDDQKKSALWLWNPEDETLKKVHESNRKISDLAALAISANSSSDPTDQDGDGVTDLLDTFPDDPTAAFAEFYPGESAWLTFAFEDLWPTVGDYDFNDLVIYSRFEKILNADNKLVRLNCQFELKNIGGSFQNGFGFILDDFSSSLVAMVTGYELNENIVSLAANGTEDGEENATIIVFDNSHQTQTELFDLEIVMTRPLDVNLFSFTNINPFIFINLDRERELHLPGHAVTSKAQRKKQFDYVFTNNDEDGDFKAENNLPWAISIISEFAFPIPGKPINRGYLHFNEWAESSGLMYEDWYKDRPGYRKKEHLEEND